MATRDAPTQALIMRLAANKSALGLRYAEWGASTSSPATASAVTDMALDEHNHAQTLFALIQDEEPAENPASSSEPTDITPTPFLCTPLHSWLDLVAANVLFDNAFTVVLAAEITSTDTALAAVAAEIVRAEQKHAAYGDGWVRHMGSEGGPMAHNIEVALSRCWDEALCWLGPQHDPAAETLYAAGVLDAMPHVLRARLLARIGPAVTAAKLKLPLAPAARGNTWELTLPLPWERWDDTHWRLNDPHTTTGA